MARKVVVHEKLIPNAAGMVTIHREHFLWTEDLLAFITKAPDALRGIKFARVQPPESAKDELIEEICGVFKKYDVQVILQPRPKSQTITKQQQPRRVKLNTRQVVETLVAEANTPDRDALSVVVQEQLSKVGL